MRTLLFFTALVSAIAGNDCALAGEVTLSASGSSFIYPLMSKLHTEYNKLHADVKIDYSSTGSGTGIKQISEQVTDFAGTDYALSNEQLKAAKGGELIHIPITLAAVVPIYNVPGVPNNKPLVFSGPVLADIFRGKITRWNDPAILKLNAGLKLPDAEITVVHPPYQSGNTLIFTDYLSSVSPEFAKNVGKGLSIDWPAQNKVGAKGGAGITGVVQQTPGTIGYIELTFARANQLPYGDVMNSSGKPIHASLESISAAATSQKMLATDLRMTLVDPPGAKAYPISAFSYLLVYKNQANAKKGKALVEFLKWALTDGQKIGAELGYAPLPENVVKADLKLIDSIILP